MKGSLSGSDVGDMKGDGDDFHTKLMSASNLVDAKSGKGLSFNGSNELVCLETDLTGACDGQSAHFQSGVNNRTISLWYKADDLNGQQILFDEGGTVNGLNIYLDGSNIHAGAWKSRVGTWSNTATTANEWHHASFVFEDKNQGGSPVSRFYHDGVEVGNFNDCLLYTSPSPRD